MPPVHDNAICIRQWDWSETSQTVSLFCRDLGLIRALAKGARRPKAPYSGGIEILTRGRAGVITKQSSDMAILTEWDLQEQFPALRRSLAAHYAGLYVAELVHCSVHDHDPHPALFDSTLDALRSLADDPSRELAILKFQWAALVETGYRPQLALNTRTGADLPDSPYLSFSPSLGGVLEDRASERENGASWRVRRETIELLRRLPHGPLTPSGEDRHARAVVVRAGRLLAAYLRYVLGREPRMLPYLYDRQLPR